ncbi:helix-turn-helix domain-containing protein [Serratia sp. OS31]|uniref:helix-turn-helix domain-containing protein n=1 Tax=Serratia sp. OS31 TaxID=2760844 RepID=UPI001603EAD4|nr:helix-turn-helix domain-containing protein [Serratia sp. OS31]MBB1585011.1 helix-turn-helix domain-containing protein [Serratia sp. OS31]
MTTRNLHIIPTPSEPLSWHHSHKPQEVLQSLIHRFSDIGHTVSLREGETLTANGDFFWLITEGSFSLIRHPDELHLDADAAPAIFGLNELFHHGSTLFLAATKPCQMLCVASHQLWRHKHDPQLWYELTVLAIYHLQRLILHHSQLVGVDAYTMVRSKLFELMSIPIQERMHINVQQYIRQYTKLSRSGILKILSALRHGGYIDIQRGRLMSINHLPTRY